MRCHSLATILRYHGRIVPLKASSCLWHQPRRLQCSACLGGRRQYGLKTKAYRCSGEQLMLQGQFPCVIFWNDFLVLEGFDQSHAFLSDPAQGGVRVLMEDFSITSRCGSGVLTRSRFRRGGQDRSPLWMLPGLLRPYRNQLLRLMVVASALLVPNLLVAGLTTSFITDFLQEERLYFGIPIVWLLAFSCLMWLILMAVQFVVLRRLELLLSKRLTADLFEKLFSVPWAFFQVHGRRIVVADAARHANHPGGGGAVAAVLGEHLGCAAVVGGELFDLILADHVGGGCTRSQSAAQLVAHGPALRRQPQARD